MPAPEITSLSDPQTPDPMDEKTTDSVEVISTKAHGVLGWLGVRRTVRRRQSESRLNVNGNSESGPDISASYMTKEPLQTREKVKSRESLGLDAELSLAEQVHRPELRSESSIVTVMPQANQGKLSSLFSRRASSRGTLATVASNTPPILSPVMAPTTAPTNQPAEARPILNAALRNNTAASSQSSLTLPPTEPTFSPFVMPQEVVSSPASEVDEMLFGSGGDAHWGPALRPWVDSALSAQGSNRSSMSSPLGSMPEQGVLDMGLAPKIITTGRKGRVRSWSDAPLPQPGRPVHASNPHLPVGSAQSSTSRSLQPLPLTPTRPKLEGRTSSGSSAIGRMRTGFQTSSSRIRTNILLRQRSSDADEFGSLRSDEWSQGVRMQASSSSLTDVTSPPTAEDDPPVSLLGLDGDAQIYTHDITIRSPRSSLAASMSSFATGSSTRAEVSRDPVATVRATRPRASTMSNGPSIYNFAPSPSPGLFPVAATPPRRRPNAIQRFSSGIFGSGPPSPKGPSPLFPLPPRSTGLVSSGVPGTDDEGANPRRSIGSVSALESIDIKRAMVRDGEEAPEEWLTRTATTIHRREIANVLAARWVARVVDGIDITARMTSSSKLCGST